MTRAAPAKLFGFTDRGQLGEGALADIAVYRRMTTIAQRCSATRISCSRMAMLVVRDGTHAPLPLGQGA